jgi:hypothetical protein
MKRILKSIGFLTLTMGLTAGNLQAAETEDVKGVYKAVLQHEGTNFYQLAKLTLRTVNVGGQIKVSANAQILFGDWDSTEFVTYNYDEVSLNVLTRQLGIKNEKNDVSMIGFLKSGVIEGEWFSTIVGRVGTFKALKVGVPEIPQNGILVKTLSGFYKGSLTNTNALSNLPERVTLSFVTTQEYGADGPKIKISGNVRFYLGGFDSLEYVETTLSDIQFNFYTRYLTLKTQDHGLTFKGFMTQDGKFDAAVLSDGLGDVAKIAMTRQ